MKGIDISKYQVGLTLAQIKKAGYEFVILRAGYTGFGENRTKNIDSSFERFYKMAKAENMPVGAYWYSCARTKDEGIAEAEFLYNKCLKGKAFEMPIYIDVEDPTWQAKSKKGVTDAIIGFCDYLQERKYFVGVYASLSWFNNKIDTGRLSAYSKWVASWSDQKPSFRFNGFDMWQNSNNALIGSKRVDSDICFINLPSIIAKAGLNGFSRVKETVIHIVKSGETLTSIANRYGKTVDEIAKTNNIKNINKIVVGQALKI